jgi:hypothetical protein
MAEKTPKSLPSRPPPWPDPVSADARNIPPVHGDPPPWWWHILYDPAPPWWDQLKAPDKATLAAAHLAYERSMLQAKLIYIDKLMEVLK